MKTLLRIVLISGFLGAFVSAEVKPVQPVHFSFADAQDLQARVAKLAADDPLAKAHWAFFQSVPGSESPLALGVDVIPVPNFDIRNYIGFYLDEHGSAHYGEYAPPFRGYRVTISKITSTVSEKYKCRTPDPGTGNCEALFWTTMRIEADVITGACPSFKECDKLYGIKVRKVWTSSQPATHGGISSAGGD